MQLGSPERDMLIMAYIVLSRPLVKEYLIEK